jgi:large subunit ribosomal protein L6
MSKIGKAPITLNSGVTAAVDGSTVKISGPKGQYEYQIPKGLEIVVADGKVIVKPINKNDKKINVVYGLARASLANILKGVEKEFEKKLELVGVGYKAAMQGNNLSLSLGFAHPVIFTPGAGVKISVAANTVIVSGTDKALVGDAAAKIRAVKPPEPYKGKGIKYAGEQIRRKAGKAAKAAGAK